MDYTKLIKYLENLGIDAKVVGNKLIVGHNNVTDTGIYALNAFLFGKI